MIWPVSKRALLFCGAVLTIFCTIGQPVSSPAQNKKNDNSKSIAVPNNNAVAILVHSTIISYNHGNLTGNYSVLRNLASPEFQHANSADRLSKLFAKARARKIDLTPVVLHKPNLVQKPQIDKRGLLQINGFYPTAPERVYFRLGFKLSKSHWKLFSLAISIKNPKIGKVQEKPSNEQNKVSAGKKPTTTSETKKLEAKRAAAARAAKLKAAEVKKKQARIEARRKTWLAEREKRLAAQKQKDEAAAAQAKKLRAETVENRRATSVPAEPSPKATRPAKRRSVGRDN